MNHERMMDLTVEDWKPFFPISAVFKPPLLLSGSSAAPFLGPLIFNPSQVSLINLFSSPSLLPHLSPPPFLNLRRFLLTSTSTPFLIPPSTSSSIAYLLGHQPHEEAASSLCFNRLQFLRCPNANRVAVFFPTGPNSDQVGFLMISANGMGSNVQADENGNVFTAKNVFNYRIHGISVNPIGDLGFGCRNVAVNNSSLSIGYLLAFTMYSVDWFSVEIEGNDLNSGKVRLVHVGGKVFRSHSIVHTCWSSHLPEESAVLLDSGELFLFDLESVMRTESWRSNRQLKGSAVRVPWDDLDCSGNYKWLSCEFSWHPRILIVARSDAIFLVDMRLDECKITVLLKIEMLDSYASMGNEQFLAFSKAQFDGFYFTLASDSLLLLCDVRKPLMPVLQWVHGLEKPCYIDVLRLSDLRSHPRNDLYQAATESGFCIILGSFWSCEFSTFCYGPSLPAASENIPSRFSKFYESLYAWEIPSGLSLSGRDFCCGSCLVREKIYKDSLPEWINWQQKKEILLGFGILDKDLSKLLSEPDEYGGFTVVRLMSSGTLESQRYRASWNCVTQLEEAHKCSMRFLDYLLYSMDDREYRFPKRYRFLKFDFLTGYLNDRLDKVLDSKVKKSSMCHLRNVSYDIDFHEILCEKLKACGFSGLRSSPAISVAFNDISLPASVHEVALRRLWMDLPMEILQLAFSNNFESLETFLDHQNSVSVDILAVPSIPQLPPFFLRSPSNCSNKPLPKMLCTDALIGPVLPLPVLLVLHELRNGGLSLETEETVAFSLDAELDRRFNEVGRVATETVVSHNGADTHDDYAVSLADDREDMIAGPRKTKPFILYHPASCKGSTADGTQNNSIGENDTLDSLIFKVRDNGAVSDTKPEKVGEELFDDLCPVQLRFDSQPMNFGLKECQAYNLLKRQLSKWEEGFDLYQEFCTRSNFYRHDI